MTTFSKTSSIHFAGPDSGGFDMSLGDLAHFVEQAKAEGAENSDPVFAEYDEREGVIGFNVILGTSQGSNS